MFSDQRNSEPDERNSSLHFPGRSKAKKYQAWIGVIISIVFLFLVLRGIEADQFIQIIQNIELWPLLPAIVIYILGVILRAFRWKLLLEPMKVIPIVKQFKVIAIGYMANNLLPLRAGEFYRAHLLGTMEKIPRSAVFTSIILERVFDGLTMLFFLAILSLVVVSPFPGWVSTIAYFSFLFFLGFFVFFLFIVLSPRIFSKVVDISLKIVPEKFNQPARTFLDNAITGLNSLKGWRTVFMVLLLSIVTWLFEAGMYYLLFFAFPFKVGYLGAILLVTLVNLGIMIPSSPGYVGTFEFFCTHTLAIFAVNETMAFSYSILLHLTLFLPITLIGFYYFLVIGIFPHSKKKGNEAANEG